MNKTLQQVVWLIFIAPAIYLAIVWASLPDKIAMHYDLHGNPTRYGSKNEMIMLVVILTVMNIFIYFLLTNIYRIDPRKYAIENKGRLQRMAFAVVVFVAAVLFMIIYSSRTASIHFRISWIFSAVGLLLAIIGNYLPNLKPNYFAGIRLPWTLENETNWRKTHQLAGKIWFVGGLVLAVVCIFLPPVATIIIFFCAIMIMVIIPGVYSYRLYKQQKAGGN